MPLRADYERAGRLSITFFPSQALASGTRVLRSRFCRAGSCAGMLFREKACRNRRGIC